MTPNQPPMQIIKWDCTLCGKSGLGGPEHYFAHLANCRFSRGGFFLPNVSDAPYKSWLAQNLKTLPIRDDSTPKEELKPTPTIQISLNWLIKLIVNFIHRRLR